MKKSILVSGQSGQLAKGIDSFSELTSKYDFVFKKKNEMDLESESDIKRNLSYPFDYFINTAAYTFVDKAESEIDKSNNINSKALEFISKYAQESTTIIHFSTDYVYDSNSSIPLSETDPCNPKSQYGKSKLEGERILLKNRPDSLLIRTSWLYSSYGNNFVSTMLRLAKEHKEIKVVADQIGTPSYTKNLVRFVFDLLEKKAVGIYNYSDEGYCSWAEFAREIFELCEIDCRVIDISSEAYSAEAPRPRWNVLSKDKLKVFLKSDIPLWKESLRKCLIELGYRL